MSLLSLCLNAVIDLMDFQADAAPGRTTLRLWSAKMFVGKMYPITFCVICLIFLYNISHHILYLYVYRKNISNESRVYFDVY